MIWIDLREIANSNQLVKQAPKLERRMVKAILEPVDLKPIKEDKPTAEVLGRCVARRTHRPAADSIWRIRNLNF